jgi:sporulation protein YlmC with PRC-barrel domain
MPMKALAAALLGSALIAAPALSQTTPQTAPGSTAQQPAATSQQPAASSQPAASGQQAAQMQKSGSWRASKLVGLNVYNQQNEKIGDINELIADQSGKIDIVVVGVGGFLGLGEHRVGLPFSQVKFLDQPARVATSGAPATTGAQPGQQRTTTAAATTSGPREYPDHAVVNMSKDQLKALPAFKYASDTSSDRTPARTDAPAQRAPQPAQPAPSQPQPR